MKSLVITLTTIGFSFILLLMFEQVVHSFAFAKEPEPLAYEVLPTVYGDLIWFPIQEQYDQWKNQ